MCCLDVNVCWDVVTNFQVLSYSVKNQTGVKQTHVQQYVFMSTENYHAVHFMADAHKNVLQHVKCAPRLL